MHLSQFNPRDTCIPLKVYDTDLPSSQTAPYLGVFFGQHGINWALLAKEDLAKAHGVIVVLALVKPQQPLSDTVHKNLPKEFIIKWDNNLDTIAGTIE
ncbi:hypothetical protein HDU81_011170, partial [Chytriomyces hyalinus]